MVAEFYIWVIQFQTFRNSMQPFNFYYILFSTKKNSMPYHYFVTSKFIHQKREAEQLITNHVDRFL